MYKIVSFFVSLAISSSVFASEAELGSPLIKGTALKTLFWNAGKITYKIKAYNKIVDAPLSDFLGNILADTNSYLREDVIASLSSSVIYDGGCRYVLNVPEELEGMVSQCSVWIDKTNGTDKRRYTISFTRVKKNDPALSVNDNITIEQASVKRSWQSINPDGSLSEAKLLN